jgi:peptidoglycan/LPS O-acetylase OafA/YrhL
MFDHSRSETEAQGGIPNAHDRGDKAPTMLNNSSSVKSIGIVLISAGFILLVVRGFGIDLMPGRSFWPTYIITPGALLLALASFDNATSKALAPVGMMITLTGCVLAYQNWADHYQSWAYAWIIVGPFALGSGLVLHGHMHADEQSLRDGTRTAALSFAAFAIAAAVFELVFNISGLGFSAGLPWGVLLSIVLIAVGGAILLRKSKQV